jgi:hypothetical protein
MPRVLALAAALVVLIGACAKGEGERRAGGNVTPAASGQSRDDRCPDALMPMGNPFRSVLRAVRRQIPDVFRDVDTEGSSVSALFPVWLVGRGRVTRGRDSFLEVAARACGRTIARRSWVANVDLPAAPHASFGPALTYLAKTSEGWRVWLIWFPNMSRRGFFPCCP